MMETLADNGNGSYAYVDDLDEARKLFVEDLTSTLQVIALDAKIQVEFHPSQVLRYRLLGFENRDVADRHREWLHSLPTGIDRAALLEQARNQGDPQLRRLTREYLPVRAAPPGRCPCLC